MVKERLLCNSNSPIRPKLIYEYLFDYFFSIFQGQLWKLTDEMKLINSNGNWLHQGNAWTITAEGSEGNIEDQTSGRVLGILNDAFDIGKVKISLLDSNSLLI